MTTRTVALIAAFVFAASASAGGDASLFTCQVLPGLGDDIRVFDLNESGTVVGFTKDFQGDRHGAIWIDGTLHPLGTLQGDDSWYLTGVNDAGHAVGVANLPGPGNPNDYVRAFRWIDADADLVVDDAEITLFHPAGTEEWSEPTDIGNGGHVCGIVDYWPSPISAFVSGVVVAPFGSEHTESWAVNDSGAITGNYWSAGSEVWRAYRYEGGTVSAIPGLGGFITQGQGINNGGEVVGWAYRPDWTYTAFLWLDEPAYGLPAGFAEFMPGHDDAWANDINDGGVIVGYGYKPEFTGFALGWIPNGDGTYTEYDLQAVADGVPAGWTFVEAIAINNAGQVLVRASDGSGVDRAAILTPMPVDSDQDGLLDDWETDGIPYEDSTGASQRYLLDLDGDGTSDADPMRKDLFVEVDAMAGQSISAAALDLVRTAFADAPVPNPDGSTGVTLHVMVDDGNLPHVATWATNGCWPTDFYDYANAWYGTSAERGDPDASPIIGAKLKAFRYCIVADEADSGVGGCGEKPGDDFVIFLGGAGYHDGNHDEFDMASVFMHELGHNLGLGHGGHDSINGKPNYPSIMNYTMSYRTTWNEDFWTLDFCRVGSETLDDLDETWLDEAAGVGTAGGIYADFWMPFGINFDDGTGVVRDISFLQLDGSSADFGDLRDTGFPDGDFDDGVAQDLNYVIDPPAGIILPSSPSPGETHVCHNDWANLIYATPAALGSAGPVSYPTDELTVDAWLWIDQNFPSPPALCPADLTGDGAVDVVDLLAVLENWGGAGGDVTGDGVTTLEDLLAVLAAWGPC